MIKGAEPFYLQGGERGVILIHGFTGNPAEMLLLGKYLQSKNFTVLGVRLAGHATNEFDLERSTKDDWINSVIDGYSILKGSCKSISVVGHSMGALLAIKLTTLRKVERLVTLAAPIFIDDSMPLDMLPTREESKGKFLPQHSRNLKNVPPAVNFKKKLYPYLSVHELLDLIKETKLTLPSIKLPIMIVHGEEDHTAKIESSKYIFDNVSSTQKQLKLIEGMGHLLILREGREKIFELTAEFLNGENYEEEIN